MDIEKLILQNESKTLEFKKDLSSIVPILKTVVAFANTAGGILIIGVSQQGNISGIKDVLKAEEQLVNSIADNIRPPILPEIEIITLSGKDLIVVKVAYWKAPFYIKQEGMPKGVYIRLGSTSRPASPEIMTELQRSTLHISFDQQPLLDFDKQSLEIKRITQLFEGLKREVNNEKMCSLGIISPYQHHFVPSIGGLILFGKQHIREQVVPDAKVRCARFLGSDKVKILDQYEINGTILDAVDEVPKFIARNTRLAAKITSLRRQDIAEYSSIAIREALINALVHADYSMKGSTIQIAIFDDRLEIQNPGMLPFGFTLDDLKSGMSRVRNRVIARVFHELKLMEEWGSGYKRIIEACRKGGYPEPKWEELGMAIRVTFYPHSETLLFNQAKEQKKELTQREEAILKLFNKNKHLAFRDIFKKMSRILSERMLRYELAQLKKRGLLISKGRGRATIWMKNDN